MRWFTVIATLGLVLVGPVLAQTAWKSPCPPLNCRPPVLSHLITDGSRRLTVIHRYAQDHLDYKPQAKVISEVICGTEEHQCIPEFDKDDGTQWSSSWGYGAVKCDVQLTSPDALQHNCKVRLNIGGIRESNSHVNPQCGVKMASPTLSVSFDEVTLSTFSTIWTADYTAEIEWTVTGADEPSGVNTVQCENGKLCVAHIQDLVTSNYTIRARVRQQQNTTGILWSEWSRVLSRSAACTHPVRFQCHRDARSGIHCVYQCFPPTQETLSRLKVTCGTEVRRCTMKSTQQGLECTAEYSTGDLLGTTQCHVAVLFNYAEADKGTISI